ncbi:MAG: flagellar basal-body MS-ring/collar protein FliF [Balneolales bacterium]
MGQLLANFRNFFSPLNGAQRALFGLLSVGLLIIIGLIFFWALKPSYAVLFSSLTSDSAQEIVEGLDSNGIQYELRDNGSTIRVPRDMVHDLRLKYAASGGSSSDYKGYELFDENALGMTDFMQRLNQKRALEGEISKTINSLGQVESSRVHIVIPERSPFQEQTVEPSSSVIVNLKSGQSLNKQQIEGISALISGSVEGLSNEDVVILDQSGNRISDNISESSDFAASSSQMKVRKNMEEYLVGKGQSMLDRVLGPGNSILRVSTEHNFDRLIRESNIIDPDSRVVISEENRTTRNAGQTQEPVQGELEVEPFQLNVIEDETLLQVRNYEVNKTTEQEESSVGEIDRISASLLLNHKNETVDGEIAYIPYTQDELDEISEIMSTALGIVPDRGDEITVTQMQFQDPYSLQSDEDGWMPQPIPYEDIIKYVFLTIAMIVIAAMVYRLSKNMGLQYEPILLEGEPGTGERLRPGLENRFLKADNTENDDDDIYVQKMSDEARYNMRASEVRTKEISEFMNKNPDEAAGLVRTMMNEEA